MRKVFWSNGIRTKVTAFKVSDIGEKCLKKKIFIGGGRTDIINKALPVIASLTSWFIDFKPK
jgi:hypothetical protein